MMAAARGMALRLLPPRQRKRKRTRQPTYRRSLSANPRDRHERRRPPRPSPPNVQRPQKIALKEKSATPSKAEPAPAAKAAEPAHKAAQAATGPRCDTNEADADKADAKAAKKEAKKPVPSAKQLFGTVKTAAPLKARAVGWYAKGCLAGGKPLAVDGPGWQVMRLSRNRNWGHPDLVALLERLAKESTAAKEWSGLLVGDMSQPRGGPMTSGHASHQVGLDADIWLTPMPDRTLTKREREDMSAVSMLANAGAVDPKVLGRWAGQADQARRVLHVRRAHPRPPGPQESALRSRRQGSRTG